MQNFRNVLWGMVLIIIGCVLGLNALEITNINLLFDGWWTLFIIVPCFIGLFDYHESHTGNIIGLAIGILLLLSCWDFLDFDMIWKLVFPIILVVIGLSFVFKNSTQKSPKNLKDKTSNISPCIATFSEQNLKFDKEEFKGCNLESIFGNIKLDLREATIKDDVIVNSTCIFGGIDIYVPHDVQIKINSTSIFGGVENKAVTDKTKKTIYINATCIFGGVDIK